MTEPTRSLRERAADSLWRALMRAASAVPRRLEKELSGTGLSPAELDVLLALVRGLPDAVRIGEIASDTGMTFSRASRAVASLERRGLTERESCDADGRGNQARITAGGAELIDRLETPLGLRSEILMPDDDATTVTSYLDAVADRADSDPGVPLPGTVIRHERPAAGDVDPAQLLDDLVRAQIEVWNAAEHAARAASGLSLPWYEVLRAIDREGAMRGVDLARVLLITEGGASRLLSRIEAAGMLTRQTDPADARASLFSLTDDGRALLRATSDSVRTSTLTIMGERLAADEIDDLARILTRFRREPEPSQCA